jgi:hypothetical protein
MCASKQEKGTLSGFANTSLEELMVFLERAMGIEQNTLRFLNDFNGVTQNHEIVLSTQHK